ncbi:MAG: TolC family protein [Terriglobales bacterium]
MSKRLLTMGMTLAFAAGAAGQIPGQGAAGAIAGISLQGGVPQGTVSATPVTLSLDDAIARGLRANLGLLLSSSAETSARAARLRSLSSLLPQVNGSLREAETKINLQAFGFSFPGVNPIVGPFRLFDLRAAVHQPVLAVAAWDDYRAARVRRQAAQLDYAGTRDLVVLAVANQYLLTSADYSRVTAAQAQLRTAEQAFGQAQDMKRSGVVSGLDVVRAQVERERERQFAIAARNDLAKQELRLARVIGLPPGQSFTLSDEIPYAPLAPLQLPALIGEALQTRADYRAAQARVHAGELALAAARAQRLPTANFDADYGTIGNRYNSNHPTFTLAGSLNLPVFTGGRIRAAVLEAQTQLQDARNRAADLRAGVEDDVRTALLDVQSSQQQVAVAQGARALAAQELTLARDRFQAGVAGNLEEVQAQQEVAVADENYIASLYSFNAAKASLARALGVAETAYNQYLRGR